MHLCENVKDARTIRFFQGLEDRLLEKFGGKYNYKNTVYKGKRHKFTYTCPIHGLVSQVAGEHTRGRGCLQCRYRETGLTHNNKIRDSLIESLKEVHGDRFDYSKVEYINDKTKIIVICKKHGEFSVKVRDHKKGGCPQCSLENRSRTLETFYRDVSKIHNNKYTYKNLPKIIKVNTNLKITCPLHGEFKQALVNHLRGNGCPLCAQKEIRWSKAYYTDKETTLYYVKIGNFYKIGLTKRNIHKRFSNEKVKDSLEVLQLWTFKNGGIAFEIEQECLKATAQYATNVVLLRKGGNTELRTIDVLSIIKPIIEEPFK